MLLLLVGVWRALHCLFAQSKLLLIILMTIITFHHLSFFPNLSLHPTDWWRFINSIVFVHIFFSHIALQNDFPFNCIIITHRSIMLDFMHCTLYTLYALYTHTNYFAICYASFGLNTYGACFRIISFFLFAEVFFSECFCCCFAFLSFHLFRGINIEQWPIDHTEMNRTSIWKQQTKYIYLFFLGDNNCWFSFIVVNAKISIAVF